MSDSIQRSDVSSKTDNVTNEKKDSTIENDETNKDQDEAEENADKVTEEDRVEKMDVDEKYEKSQAVNVIDTSESQKVLGEGESENMEMEDNSDIENTKKVDDSKESKENDDVISDDSVDNIDRNKDTDDDYKSSAGGVSENVENLNNEEKEHKMEEMDCTKGKYSSEVNIPTEPDNIRKDSDEEDEKMDTEDENKETLDGNKERDESIEEEKENSHQDVKKTNEDTGGKNTDENKENEKENSNRDEENISDGEDETNSNESEERNNSYKDIESTNEDASGKNSDEYKEKDKGNSDEDEEKMDEDTDEKVNDENNEKSIKNSDKDEDLINEDKDKNKSDENKEKEKENSDEGGEEVNEDMDEKVSDEKEKENSDRDEEETNEGEVEESNDEIKEKEKENFDKDEETTNEDMDETINNENENSDKEKENKEEKSNDRVREKDNESSDKDEEKTSKDIDENEKEKESSDKDEEKTGESKDKNRETIDIVSVNMETDNENENGEMPTSSSEVDKDANEQDMNKSSDTCDVSSINDENSIFVQINNEKDDLEKSTTSSEQVSTDVDPIGSSDWNQNNENNENTFISDLDEADECIIPDTNRDENMSADSTKELDTTLNTTAIASTSAESDRMKLSEKYLVSVANNEEQSNCMICKKKKACKYNCTKDNDKTTLCSEDCLTKLKEQHTDNVIVRQLRVKNFSLDKNLQATDDETTETTKPTGNISCKNCTSVIKNINKSLSWEAFDFCNEQCLTKHQKLIGSFCANCRIEVKENFLGKYCVRFGYNVRQFCSSTCLEQYKKNSKVCSYCQDNISGNTSGFLTSIGDRGMSKDFCSAQCMQKYNEISKHLKGAKFFEKCCVCHKHNVIEIEFDYKNNNVLFCSEPCFVAFKYVNEVNPEKCDMCCKYYISQPSTNFLIRYDGVFRKFCQRTCQNIYITTNRKIVSCCWCKVKKYNFDMIQKYSPDSSVLVVCSLTCLNFFNASINASKIKRKRCDFCHKICKGQYHITLADDSMKNFCSYPCVQEYQNKYLLAPARYSEQPVAIASNPNVRVTRKSSSIASQRKQIIPDVPGPLPIITSVRSLAPAPSSSINTRSLRSKSSAPGTIATITSLQTEPPLVKRVIVLRPPDLTAQRNVATLVKPITKDVEVEFKPIMVDKAVQTEDIKDSLVLVPVPVPIYIPSPMQMFNLSLPKPVPFPLPIPVPMFVPITKQTANVILKEMKKNHKNTPTDPYEADLLMMAELVAGENEKKEPIAESDAEADSDGDNNAGGEASFSPEPQDGSNTFGDDMLQMALKMASDFEEPAVDLEGALTASTITATSTPNEQVDDVAAPIQPPPVERTRFRGRRRGRPPRHGGRGRGRGRPPTQQEIVVPIEPEPQPPPEPVEKPDANMCLKYTFGVNAWKQWVTTKNAELEKSSRRTKPFKSDLLQLTSDELNYSLCLFVKEVRKPNGAEYAPDTIYYLCLGIQQYLFENGRIDNIFCDSYYESFTDCLDEVCKKFSTLYNDSQYIVTRVEEEHLWESKQLGAHSPHVLLTTLMFFNTKHFNLTNVEEHMQLSFSHIMKHWKRVPNQAGTSKNSSSRNILLRFYPPQSAVEGNNRKKKVYEQQENEENPLRCPVKLYEFYLSKCPESVKTRNDVFYLLPERSCVPDSPVWYSTMALGKEPLEKMLHRVKMVKEINVALLAS